MLRVRIWADSLRADFRAQDLVEYALMGGFVATTCGALMPNVSVEVSRIFSSVASVMNNSKNQGS